MTIDEAITHTISSVQRGFTGHGMRLEQLASYIFDLLGGGVEPMKKNSKKVLKAIETIHEYCTERECEDCIFARTNGCALALKYPEHYDGIIKTIKHSMREE